MHRIVVNVQTGEVAQVEYTAQEQAEYEAALAAEAARLAAEQAAQGEQIDSGN